MMRLLLFFFLSLFAINSFSDEVEQRRNKIISIIDEELNEVRRLSVRGGEKNPDLLLRVAELYLEKARLFRERENSRYLDLPIKKRQKVNKKSYFSKSARLFEEANKTCRKITTKFKRYKKMGEVYYILGYNQKEAGKVKSAVKYLDKATGTSKNKKVKVKSQITLADIYFNEEKFSKAKNLYEKALSSYRDKWWTKDSFNLAWCYYNLNRHSDAISKMKEVHRLSSQKKYVDMRAQVERDIGLFYATSGKIDEGIKFYQRVGVNFSKQLYGIAFSLKKAGKFKDAEKVLKYSINYTPTKDDTIDTSLELLDIYQKSGRYDKHGLVVERLFRKYKKVEFSKAQKKTYIFQIEKLSAILQRQVLEKTYKRLKKQRKTKAEQAKRYFQILSEIDSNRYDEFQFLKGETSYALGQYGEAYNSYKKTFEYSVKKKKTKFKRKSIDNMLVTLSRFNKKYDYNIYVFEQFVANYPKDKNTKTIYGRLFNNYMSKKDYKNAKYTLERFSKKYPRDNTQEAMIAQLMDVRRKQGNNKAVRAWILDIEAGKYFVSKKYRTKLQELLTTMQMEDVQGELKKGNKKVAMEGYLSVLDDKYSTKRSKINAKYNLSALFFELGNVERSFHWSKEALKDMDNKDVMKFESSFITIANFLFMSLDLKRSSKLSNQLLQKICKTKSKRKTTVFKNAGFMSLADGNIALAVEVRDQGVRCGISKSVINELNYEIMREAFIRKNYDVYEKYVVTINKNKDYKHRMLDEFLNLIEIYKEFDDQNKISKYKNLLDKQFYQAKKEKKLISLKVLDYYANLEVRKMRLTYKKVRDLKLSFPEAKFQKSVESLLANLDKLVGQANRVIQVGSGNGIITSYGLLNDAYLLVAKKLRSFTPPGKGAEYIKGFKRQFEGIAKQMTSAAMRYEKEATRAIKKNEILSHGNRRFLPVGFPVFYDSNGVLMERGGV